MRLTLEMGTADANPLELRDIPFRVSVERGGEFILSSKEQQTPWKFLVRISKELKQMSISFTLNYAGLSVDEALEALAFYSALVRGGRLTIRGRHPVTGGDLAIASAAITPKAYPNPDRRLVKTLNRLATIEKKTGATFSIPTSDISYEVANEIAATALILQTGHARYEAQPWTSISPVEQAKQALETFKDGNSVSMAVHFDAQVMDIFGTHVMLGPVTLFCNRMYIAPKDLEELREQLQSAQSDDMIKIRFSPFEDDTIEARYVNWLPDDEAEAIRQLPMYQGDDVTRQEEVWAPPTADIDTAVSLLESWYDEDAAEQKASWQSLKMALDRDRLSDRKLFS